MGMDNSTWIETRVNGKWQKAEIMDGHDDDKMCGFPFEWRNYTMYAFLSDGTNSRVKNLPTGDWAYRSYPDDSEWLNEKPADTWYGETRRAQMMDDGNDFGHSWVLLAELLAFDYDQLWESPRGPETVRDNLGEMFFTHLELLKAYGAPDDVRVVYCFN